MSDLEGKEEEGEEEERRERGREGEGEEEEGRERMKTSCSTCRLTLGEVSTCTTVPLTFFGSV